MVWIVINISYFPKIDHFHFFKGVFLLEKTIYLISKGIHWWYSVGVSKLKPDHQLDHQPWPSDKYINRCHTVNLPADLGQDTLCFARRVAESDCSWPGWSHRQADYEYPTYQQQSNIHWEVLQKIWPKHCVWTIFYALSIFNKCYKT